MEKSLTPESHPHAPSLLLAGHKGAGPASSPVHPQLASDPALRRKLARLSAGSFARLAELFSSREGSPCPSHARPSWRCPGPPPPSPEPLARLALAMELSRRVAWLGGTLAGLSVEHVHSFTPWIQAQGGWVSRPSPPGLPLPNCSCGEGACGVSLRASRCPVFMERLPCPGTGDQWGAVRITWDHPLRAWHSVAFVGVITW